MLKSYVSSAQVYASLCLDRGRITVPWRSQELYFAKWLIKHGFISEQCAFNLVNSGNMKQRNTLTSKRVPKSFGIWLFFEVIFGI